MTIHVHLTCDQTSPIPGVSLVCSYYYHIRLHYFSVNLQLCFLTVAGIHSLMHV